MKNLHRVFAWFLLSFGSLVALDVPGLAAPIGTTLLSRTAAGVQGNHNSGAPAISADGRFVAFVSSSQTLGLTKTTTVDEIFLRDNQTAALTRVSVGPNGSDPNGASSAPSLSADGRFLVFHSTAKDLLPNGVAGVYLYDRTLAQLTFLVAGESPVISRDGRYVAFSSRGENLVANDTNRAADVFVLDRQTSQIDRVSVSSSGVEGDDDSGTTGIAVSEGGRFVAFQSNASNLVFADTNAREDIFVHDRQTGLTTRESIATDGTQADQASFEASISADGRHLVFASRASNLVLNDFNGVVDVFLRDRQAGQTSRLSIGPNNAQATLKSGNARITPSGRYVTFESDDSTLVSGDTNLASDVFIRDLSTSTLERVSLTDAGGEAAGISDQGMISDDGRYVAFRSGAANVVPNDTNASTDVFLRGPLLETPGVLAFTTQPDGAAAGIPFTAQPVVEVRNTAGTRKWDFTGPVTIAVKAGSGRAGATLSGTATVTAVNGLAIFTDLGLDLAGSGYVLAASAGTMSGESAPFTVAQVPVMLAFATQPSGAAGQPFATQPVVHILDVEGNIVSDYSGPVTVSIKPGTGRAGALLSGTTTVNAVNGVATFSGLAIDLAGTGYVLAAESGSLAPSDSATFSIAQTATHLVFSTHPVGNRAGAFLGTQPVVQARDAEGNVAANFEGPITVAIKPGTGDAGAVLGGTTTINAVAGEAKFAGLSIDKAAPGYVLIASGGALAPGESDAFAIIAVPFTVADVATALREAGGLSSAIPAEFGVFNVARSGPSAAIVDLADAWLIARKALGAEPNP